MKANQFKEDWKKKHPKEWKKLQWDIPYQIGRIWFRVKMFFITNF
jgi:hypothetical protein